MTKSLKILSNIIFVLLIVFLSIYFILRLLGIAEIYKIKTGSMEDGIHTGDYILILKKNNYKVGDVVTYRQKDYYVTHRIIKKKGNNIITKGDANNIDDGEIAISKVVGKVIYSGGILNFLITYKYVIVGFLLVLYLISYYLDKKEPEEEK